MINQTPGKKYDLGLSEVQVVITGMNYTSRDKQARIYCCLTVNWAKEPLPPQCPNGHDTMEGASGFPWCPTCGWEYRPGGSIMEPGGVRGAVYIPDNRDDLVQPALALLVDTIGFNSSGEVYPDSPEVLVE
jgi:hypothetical protein